MPFKSQAQRRKFYALRNQGKMSQEMIDEWESHTPKNIPERVGKMEKNAFHEGFEKRAMGALGTSASLAGLGVLAAPSVSGLAGSPWKEKNKDIAEIAGLGMIAAPELHDLRGMLQKGVVKAVRRGH